MRIVPEFWLPQPHHHLGNMYQYSKHVIYTKLQHCDTLSAVFAHVASHLWQPPILTSAEAVHAERRLPAAEQSSVEHWEAQMRSAFAPPVNLTHAEQVTGSHDWAGDSRGVRGCLRWWTWTRAAYRQCFGGRDAFWAPWHS